MHIIIRPMNSQQSSIIYMMFKRVPITKQYKKNVFENDWLIVHYRVFLETALTVLKCSPLPFVRITQGSFVLFKTCSLW